MGNEALFGTNRFGRAFFLTMPSVQTYFQHGRYAPCRNAWGFFRNCGVGIGTVYNYFSSKDALIAQFLLQDWNESLERIHLAVRECSEEEAVCAAVYRELTAYYTRYADLFHAAETVVPAPPRKYHAILREQIARVFRPLCEDEFTADFLAEAMRTWTVAGIPFDQLFGLLKKTMTQ